ncbi:glycosyltransferase [Polymorphospora rubra]|uniref:glycosyltransferase n=1 Tax=Polymorphospora rubra TaxID=338584 RepID=UPI0033F5E2FB
MTGCRLRVALMITRLADGAGGVALRGALALDPARYEITVVTGGRTPADDPTADDVLFGPEAVKDPPAGDLLGQAYTAGLDVARVPTLVPGVAPCADRAALAALTRIIADGGYDVVHTHTAKAGTLGRAAAAHAGTPRIVHTFHGLPFHPFQAGWRRRAHLATERWLARRTHAFLAVGPAVAAEAVRRRVAAPERIRTILPAVEPTWRAPGTTARGLARLALGVPPGVRVVGTVGRVGHQKAPEDWIDALAALGTDDVWGVWVGDGPGRRRLLDRARRRGLAGRFRLLGHRDDVADLLPAFDVFALASRYEGLPCTVIEAIGAGLPVAATAVAAVPDVVVPGETGLLVPPGRPRELARAVRHLLDQPAEAARMAIRARERIGDRFTPRALGRVLDHTYRGGRPWR